MEKYYSISIALVLAFFSLSMWAQEAEPLPLNSAAPMFEAKDQQGNQIVLADVLQEGPVVVVFYRGQWCPYCNRHMQAFQDSMQMIQALGATVIAITPEQDAKIDKTVEKSGAQFSIIYDENHEIMDAYKVTYKFKGFKKGMYRMVGINIDKAAGNDDSVLPVPATYIIDSNGLIVGLQFDENYRYRMTVKDILKVLEGLR